MSTLARRLGRFVPRGRFERNIVTVAGGAALAQGIGLAAAPLLTRLYTPADFGVQAALAAGLAIAVVSAGLCYEMAIPLPEAEEDARALFTLATALMVMASTLAALGIWAEGPAIAAAFGLPTLAPFLWWFPVALLLGGLGQAGNAWAVRRRDFSRVAHARFGQALGQTGVGLGLGLHAAGPLGLLIGDLVGRATSVALFLSGMGPRAPALAKTGVTSGRVAVVGRQYCKFPLLTSGGALLSAVCLQIPTLMLAAFYGPLVLGYYALGQRVIGLPLGLVGEAVAQVYLGEAARLAREDPPGLARLFCSTTGRLAAVGLPPVIGLALFAPWAFTIVFGERWHDAGAMAQLLAPMIGIQFVANPLGGTLGVLERHDLYLVREVVRLVLMVGSLVAANATHADAWGAMRLLCLAGCLSYLVYACLGWRAVVRHAQINPSERSIP